MSCAGATRHGGHLWKQRHNGNRKGHDRLKLFAQDAPNTVHNFVDLTKKGFYDGLTFHRVIPNFLDSAQCCRRMSLGIGKPKGTEVG